MSSKKFFVCLDEITQNFVFAEQFSGSYTKTVTLSNGSTRTVKLTPMIHDKFGEVVELNDSGHISYMGPNGTTTNGKLMVALRDLPMLYSDEKSCATAILSSPVVQTLYRTLGTDPEIIAMRVNNLQEQDDNPDSDFVLMAETPSQRHQTDPENPISREVFLLCRLLIHGTPEVKKALTPLAGQAGDVAFFVAHQHPEAELQSRWPAPAEQTGKVLLLNDSFTQMNTVREALQFSFGMDLKTAGTKTLEVHESGVCELGVAPGINVSDLCRRLNSQWRSVGLPLYCTPQRLDPPRRERP